MTAVQQPREPVVRVTGLSVDRGGHPVMADLSLTVPAGEVTGLLGPSGSGKTTLIRALVGVQQVKAGTVEVLGEPAGSRGLRERVAYVTQSPSVYPDLSVHSNVHFFAKILGADDDNVERVIVEVDLAEQKRQLSRSAVWRPTFASVACGCSARASRAPGSRRADGWTRSTPTSGSLGSLSPAGRRRCVLVGVEPCHGRSISM